MCSNYRRYPRAVREHEENVAARPIRRPAGDPLPRLTAAFDKHLAALAEVARFREAVDRAEQHLDKAVHAVAQHYRLESELGAAIAVHQALREQLKKAKAAEAATRRALAVTARAVRQDDAEELAELAPARCIPH